MKQRKAKSKVKFNLFSAKNVDIMKFVALVFAISLFSLFPYLNNRIFYAHDLGYHLNRIMSLSDNIKSGEIPSMIHSRLLGGLGYANPLFYSELFMFVPSILMNLTSLHVLTIYKIFLLILTMATFSSMYLVSNKLYKNKKVAILSSILYTFSLYRLTDIYVRAALGELFTFIFIPLVVYGFYEIVYGENKKWWIISLAIAGISYSHLLSLVLIAIFIVALSIINVKRIFSDKKIFKNLVLAGIVSILLSVGFFGPMLEQKLGYTFYVDSSTVDAPEVLKTRAIGLSMLFGNKVIGGYATNPSEDAGCMSEGIGAILIIFGMLYFARKDKKEYFEKTLFYVGIAVLIMTTKVFPWDKLPLINVIQFPFRLNLFPVFIFALIGAKSFFEITNQKEELVVLASIILLVINAGILDNVKINWNPDRFYSYETLVEGVDQEIASKEYLPEGCKLEDLNREIIVKDLNDKSTIDFTRVGSKVTFSINKDSKINVEVPLLYYKGYTAVIENVDGTKTKLDVERNPEDGFVLLKSDKALNGTVTVKYTCTLIQDISYLITALTFAGLVCYKYKLSKIKDTKQTKKESK